MGQKSFHTEAIHTSTDSLANNCPFPSCLCPPATLPFSPSHSPHNSPSFAQIGPPLSKVHPCLFSWKTQVHLSGPRNIYPFCEDFPGSPGEYYSPPLSILTQAFVNNSGCFSASHFIFCLFTCPHWTVNIRRQENRGLPLPTLLTLLCSASLPSLLHVCAYLYKHKHFLVPL